MAENQNQPTRVNDLGFGTKIGPASGRMINPDGSFNVRRKGGGWGALNPYQIMIRIRWWKFGLIILLAYIVLNCLFASLYLLAGVDALSGDPGDEMQSRFAHAFFFSVQTFTTVGYGSISPNGYMVNIIASLEAMTGLLGFALATGIMYGRFSRPSAKIRYSENAIIAPYREVPGFMFRIVNRRQNQLIELEALVVMMWFEKVGNEVKPRFEALNLERSNVAMFPLTWTLVHPIDASSPLDGKTPRDLEDSNAEFLITIKGFDDTFSQVVHSRYSYKYNELKWGYRFLPAFYTAESGETILEIDAVDAIARVETVD
jgi:inward rectifier potassium channel